MAIETYPERLEREFAEEAERRRRQDPVPYYGEDECEMCRRPIVEGAAVFRPMPTMGHFDAEGRLRTTWTHVACRERSLADSARATERATVVPRHHDPVVADLLARVEALEAAAKRR